MAQQPFHKAQAALSLFILTRWLRTLRGRTRDVALTSFLWLLAIWLPLWGAAGADPLDTDIELWNKTTIGNADGAKRGSKITEHADLRLEVRYDPEGDFRAELGGRLNLFSANGAADDLAGEIELFKAYVETADSSYSLRLGNQIVRWGKADEISPLDNINPEDWRDGFVRHRTERKLPLPMLNLELFRGAHTLQMLYAPIFLRSKIKLFDSNWAYFGAQAEPTAVHQDYSHGLNTGTFGSRLSGTIRGFDYSFSFLSAPTGLPSLKDLRPPLLGAPPAFSPSLADLADFARRTGQEIEMAYHRRQILGFDFETVWEELGLRGDVAYVSREDFFTGRLQAVREPVVRYVVGADWSGVENCYVNLQFAQSVALDWDAEILFAERVSNGFYGELSQEFYYHNLKSGVRALYDINLGSYYYNPYLAINFWDQVNFELGLDLPGGPRDTIIGAYRNNRQGYLILRGYF